MGPKCGSRRAPTITSASPRTISCTEKPSSRGVRRRDGQRERHLLRAAARTASGVARPSRTAPTSLLCDDLAATPP